MRKLLTLIASLAILSFSGCSFGGAAPEETASGLEGTKVSTYLVGKYVSVDDAVQKLEEAGFEIVAQYASVKKGTTIVFTSEALKAEAVKPGRAHVAVSRLFVDEKEKMISFTNPVYFGKAFMQDEYNHSVFNAQLESLNKAFSGLKPSKDAWDFDELAGYHFMMGTPYYEDADELGKANETTAQTLAKVKGYKNGKGIIFELKLSDTSTLIAYDLAKRTKKFVKKVGRANAAILPWCVSIEDGQAKALNAKYYIAISYPQLTMTEFMGIATVPGAIIKDLEKPFK